MKNISTIFVVLVSFVGVLGQEPGKSVKEDVFDPNFLTDFGKWMSGEGEQVRRREVERLKAKMTSPNFIRDELLQEYISAKGQLALLEAEVVWVSTYAAPRPLEFEARIKLSDKLLARIEEYRSQIIKLLEILSRMPVHNLENQSGRKDK